MLPFFENHLNGEQNLYVMYILVTSILVNWFFSSFKKKVSRIINSPVDYLALSFVAISFLSLIAVAQDVGRAVKDQQPFITLVSSVLTSTDRSPLFCVHSFYNLVISLMLFSFLANNLKSIVEVERIFICLAIGLLATTVLGVLDYFDIVILGWIRESFQEEIRMRSIFGHSSWFAHFMTMTVPITLVSAFTPFKNRANRYFYKAILLLSIICIIYSFHRTALYSFIIICFLYCIFQYRFIAKKITNIISYIYLLPVKAVKALLTSGHVFMRFAIMIAVTAVVINYVQVNHVKDVLSTKYNSLVIAVKNNLEVNRFVYRYTDFFNLSSREYFWEESIEIFREHPVIGSGIGTYVWKYPDQDMMLVKYGESGYAQSPRSAHSLYLQILAERGISGLMIFLAILSVIFFEIFKSLKKRPGGYVRDVLLILFLIFMGFFIYSFIDYIFYVRPFELLFWLYVGVLYSLRRISLPAACPGCRFTSASLF